MRVWRLEFPDKDGVYVRQVENGHCGRILWEVGNQTPNHPMPHWDGIDMERLTDAHRYGFDTQDALCAWFDTAEAFPLIAFCPRLLIRQFEVLEEHDNVLRGKHQLAFLRDRAEVVSEERFSDFMARRRGLPAPCTDPDCLGADLGLALR